MFPVLPLPALGVPPLGCTPQKPGPTAAALCECDASCAVDKVASDGAPFKDVRQLIADNSISDYSELYRLLYDEVETYCNGKVAECIMAIAESQYKDTMVVDKEINFMSLIIELITIVRK